MISRRNFLKSAAVAALGAHSSRSRSVPAVNPVKFVDVAATANINFVHDNAASPEKYLIETMGGGCGWIDHDQNGLLDLYLVNSAPTRVYTPKNALRSALYRNNGDGTFTDVAAKAGVGAEGLFGMGVAVGDYDNDGFPDLFVLSWDRCILYHNNGDGTFTDVSDKAGVANRGKWGSSAAWFDYDNDGLLDLVIANYVDWSPAKNYWCGDKAPGMRSYCHPDVYQGQTPTLFHNNGDGTFTDVSLRSGVGLKPGNGLGVVTFDYDNDGWQDIFIANDHMPNFLFHNKRDGTFHEVAYAAGVAVGIDGQFEAGMGVDAADATGYGRFDLVVTHLDQQLARFHRNLGDGSFEDATFRSKISYATFHLSGFGRRFLDYDNDGDLDILVSNNGQAPQLLRNDGGNTNHWLEVFLIGTKSNRDGVGARVRVTAGDLVLHEQRKGGMSYQSAQDPRLHFGLGQHEKVDAIEIVWPSRAVTRLQNLKADEIVAVKEGEGLVERPFPRVLAK